MDVRDNTGLIDQLLNYLKSGEVRGNIRVGYRTKGEKL